MARRRKIEGAEVVGEHVNPPEQPVPATERPPPAGLPGSVTQLTEFTRQLGLDSSNPPERSPRMTREDRLVESLGLDPSKPVVTYPLSAVTGDEPEPYDAAALDAAAALPAVEPDRYPAPGVAYGAIVEGVFSFDPVALHERLSRELTLEAGFTDYALVAGALDRAERNVVDARRLHRGARLEEIRFEQVIGERLAALREQAGDELEAEKAAGRRSKAATIADVEARMRRNFPDEVAALETRRARLHGAVEVLDELAGAWRSRCATLRVLAERLGR